MVNEETPADFSPGVDFDTGYEATGMGDKASRESKFVLPEGMGQAMKPKSV